MKKYYARKKAVQNRFFFLTQVQGPFIYINIVNAFWGEERELNPQPTAPQAVVPPVELPPPSIMNLFPFFIVNFFKNFVKGFFCFI